MVCLDAFNFKFFGFEIHPALRFPNYKRESFSYVRNPVDIPLHPIVDRRQFAFFNVSEENKRIPLILRDGGIPQHHYSLS